MPNALLPATAAAYAPRSPPHIILHDPVEPWLTSTLKRAVHVKRPLNKTYQHTRFLTELLAGPKANWTLCSLALPKEETGCDKGEENCGDVGEEGEGFAVKSPMSPSVSRSQRAGVKRGAGGDGDDVVVKYQMIHVEAYVVHIDTVSSKKEVTFKLTQKTIDALVEYYSHFGHLAFDEFMSELAVRGDADDKKEMRKRDRTPRVPVCEEDFAQEVNRFVFRTDVRALEGIGEEGDGELLEGRALKAKRAVQALFSREDEPVPMPMPAHMPMTMSIPMSLPPPQQQPQQQQQQQQQYQPSFMTSGSTDFASTDYLNIVEHGNLPTTEGFDGFESFMDGRAVAETAAATATTTTISNMCDPAFASVMDNAFVFYPSSPPDSYTAHSPFSSPPMSFRGATASAATVPDFALTGSHQFPSPSPPPSRRHPQPLMAPLAGLAGYPSQAHMASVHEDQVSASTAGFTNLGVYADASPTMPQWYFGDEIMPMSGPVQSQERSGVRFSVGSGDGYQEGWQGQFM